MYIIIYCIYYYHLMTSALTSQVVEIVCFVCRFLPQSKSTKSGLIGGSGIFLSCACVNTGFGRHSLGL